jgi:LysR family transcriptional regulator, transcriptional activator for dmlA
LDAISDFALFRAIVDAGGISAAAVVLQSSPAAVSRRLTALEAKLGVRLADRSSRRFRLTDEGLLLYERSRFILDQIRDAEAEVLAQSLGDENCQAPRDEEGDRGFGAPAGRDHAPDLG